MRLLLFYLVLLVAQGFLSAVLGSWPAPDLFLIAVLTLLRRLRPWQLVAVAYGVGLLQDAIGHGELGLHAFGLAGGALLAALVRAQLSQQGVLERLVVILAGEAGKWLAVGGLLLWLSASPEALLRSLPVTALETVFTVLVGLWLLSVAERLVKRRSVMRKELL
jgi:rod shape-determining protein MreD